MGRRLLARSAMYAVLVFLAALWLYPIGWGNQNGYGGIITRRYSSQSQGLNHIGTT